MQPTVSCVIAGASSPEQLQQNVEAAGWKLSAEEPAAGRVGHAKRPLFGLVVSLCAVSRARRPRSRAKSTTR